MNPFLKKHTVALALVVGFPVYALVTQLGGNSGTCSPYAGGLPFLPIATAHAAPLAENSPAPSWEIPNVAGGTLKSSEFDGKVVMLNVWGTWCPPCVAELPELVKLQKQFADRGFTIVGAAFEPSGKPIADFVKNAGLNYPVGMANEEFLAAFGNVQAFPTTFFINREGKIVSSVAGAMSADAYAKFIEPLL